MCRIGPSLWPSFASETPIHKITSKISYLASTYYSVPSTSIEWLANMISLLYLIFCIPATYAIDRFGVRPVIMSAALCNVTAMTLNLLLGHGPDGFGLLVYGQVFVGLANSCVAQMPGKLSAMWFPGNNSVISRSVVLHR